MRYTHNDKNDENKRQKQQHRQKSNTIHKLENSDEGYVDNPVIVFQTDSSRKSPTKKTVH